MALTKKARTKSADAETPPEDENRKRVDEAIEKSEKLAESQLEMARLFLSRGKVDVARRRLEDLIERYGLSDAAREARKLLKSVGKTSVNSVTGQKGSSGTVTE